MIATSRNVRWSIVALASIALLSAACERPGTRPVGTVAEALKLRERDDTNVLFVLIDTLRADRLGAYGYSRNTSPNMDSLAETGLLFRDHIAQSSWTKCSMASLWTSLNPARTGVLRYMHVLPEEAETPAEALRDREYRTAGLWRNGWIAPNFGFAQGFEIYHNPRPTPIGGAVRRESPGVTIAGSDSNLIASATQFVRSHADEKWFLYLHLMDVHQYVSTEETAVFGTTYSDIYDNSILWVDSLLGHLVGELEALDLRKRTVIVIASDHGEAFGEHGTEGHARNLYAEVSETPLIISLPSAVRPGLDLSIGSRNVDIWPTILDLLGMDMPQDVDGRSLADDIIKVAQGEAVKPAPAYAQLDSAWARGNFDPQPVVYVSEGRWRLHYAKKTKRVELFDSQADPGEQHDAGAENTEERDQLLAKVERYLENADVPWQAGVPSLELDEMQLQQLRAIGYGVE